MQRIRIAIAGLFFAAAAAGALGGADRFTPSLDCGQQGCIAIAANSGPSGQPGDLQTH